MKSLPFFDVSNPILYLERISGGGYTTSKFNFQKLSVDENLNIETNELRTQFSNLALT